MHYRAQWKSAHQVWDEPILFNYEPIRTDFTARLFTYPIFKPMIHWKVSKNLHLMILYFNGFESMYKNKKVRQRSFRILRFVRRILGVYRERSVKIVRIEVARLTVSWWNMIIRNIWIHFARISGGFATSLIVSRTFVGRPFRSVDWRASRIEPGKIAKAEFLQTTTIETDDDRRIRSRFAGRNRISPRLTAIIPR